MYIKKISLALRFLLFVFILNLSAHSTFAAAITPDSIHQIILSNTLDKRHKYIEIAHNHFNKKDPLTNKDFEPAVKNGFFQTLTTNLLNEKDYGSLAYHSMLHAHTYTSIGQTDTADFLLAKAYEYLDLSDNLGLKVRINMMYIQNSQAKLQELNLDSIVQVSLDYVNEMDTASNDSKSLMKANIYQKAGDYLVLNGKPESSMPYFDLAVSYMAGMDTANFGTRKNLAHLYFSLGYQFYSTGYDGRSKKLLLNAIELFIKNDNDRNQAKCFTVLGAIYKREKNVDSAMYCFQNAHDIYAKYNHRSGQAGALENIGIAYKDLRQLDKAMESFDASFELRKNMNRPNLLIGLYVNMSNVLIQQKKYKEAEEKLLASLKLSSKLEGKEKARMVAYQNLAELYNQTGNHQDAYAYHIKFKNLNDSITSYQIQERQLAFDKQLELSEKNASIKLSKEIISNQKIQNEKQRKLLLLSIIGIVLLSILVVVIILLSKQKRKNQALVFEKEKEAKQNEILKLLSTNEITNMNSFMKGQEKERSRIASDLHDRLGSLLSTVKLHFSVLQSNLEKTDNEHLEAMNRTIELLDKSVEEVRSVSHNLTKGVITQFGLLAAVQTIQEAINATGRLNMQVVEAGFSKRLESEVEISLFRVIQEMVTNAIKHAEANELIVQFVQYEDSINIIVEDDGKGFDDAHIKTNGIGLQNMYNRINEIGATYNLDTKPGNGTTYVIELKF